MTSDGVHPFGIVRTCADALSAPLRHTGTVLCVIGAHLAYRPCCEWLVTHGGLSVPTAGFVLTQAMGVIVFWIWVGIFHLLDVLVYSAPRDSSLAHYKLRPNAPEPSFGSLWSSCVLNQFQTVALAWLLFTFTDRMTHTPVPIWSSFLWIGFYLVIADIGMYPCSPFFIFAPVSCMQLYDFQNFSYLTD
jgi:hypothetical protein